MKFSKDFLAVLGRGSRAVVLQESDRANSLFDFNYGTKLLNRRWLLM